ncbi:AroM family protein [Maridesulfovibrio sp.]|uniref:AroM family protein n=1 Tax=Maridesulfovibrio sp. TaxID=2795000 RepID=UPI002A18733C|nr:AroM family protein [Maridesulfovibrio sp.]
MSKRYKLGLVTLGQSPRVDVEPSLRSILGDDIQVCQRGALDGLSAQEIKSLAPVEGEAGIETCMHGENSIVNGVYVAKKYLLPRLVDAAEFLEKQCDYFFLLCSGQFPDLKKAVPGIIEPIVIIRSVVESIAANGHLCIVGPQSDMSAAPAQWAPYAAEVSTSAASPYDGNDVLALAAEGAKNSGADFILMDDMGFTESQRKLVHEVSGITTLGALSITARVLQELI